MLTSTRSLKNTKRFKQAKERLHPARFPTHLHDDAMLTHIHDAPAELGRKHGDGMQVVVLQAEGLPGGKRSWGVNGSLLGVDGPLEVLC